MAKKRKAGSSNQYQSDSRKTEDNAKLRIKTYRDVADSEDEFHINRDKILLEEGPTQKRRRKLQEDGIDHTPIRRPFV